MRDVQVDGRRQSERGRYERRLEADEPEAAETSGASLQRGLVGQR
jgi:hypothetical protein